jgi:hypothetical protein
MPEEGVDLTSNEKLLTNQEVGILKLFFNKSNFSYSPN